MPSSQAPSFIRRVRNRLFRRLNFGGLVLGTSFFCLTMTPSLIPRSWQLQGLLAGMTAAIGYGLGVALSRFIRRYIYGRPLKARTRKRAWITLRILGPLAAILAVASGVRWDKELRELMSMPLKEPWEVISMIALSVVFAGILLLIGRILKGLFRLLTLLAGKLMPERAAKFIAYSLALFFVVYVLAGGLLRSIFEAIDLAASISNETVQTDLTAPITPLRSGSEESVITWEELGAKGREFIAGGPSKEELDAFSGSTDALEPIRIYGGLKAAESLDGRIELVLEELDRTDAYERQAIFIQIPSGNGEIPPVNADAPEYLLAGDTAQVALQYSYAPSATTMLTNPGVGSEAGRKIVDAVVSKVSALPAENRPKVYVAGESLGSLSTEAAFSDADDMANKVDGVLMVGPTFLNKIRNELIDSRDDNSPVWLPVIDGGKTFRFAAKPSDLKVPAGEWQDKRFVYLANSSDPVGWFKVRTLLIPPDFLDEPRADDVSPSMRWMPIVTFWQTLLDLQFASGAPSGHGHRYGLNVVDGWAAVTHPDGWTDTKTQQLRSQLQPVLDAYLAPD